VTDSSIRTPHTVVLPGEGIQGYSEKLRVGGWRWCIYRRVSQLLRWFAARLARFQYSPWMSESELLLKDKGSFTIRDSNRDPRQIGRGYRIGVLGCAESGARGGGNDAQGPGIKGTLHGPANSVQFHASVLEFGASGPRAKKYYVCNPCNFIGIIF
jgi:hypothetical protein